MKQADSDEDVEIHYKKIITLKLYLTTHTMTYTHWKKNGISYNSSEKDMYLTCHSDMSDRHIIKDMPYFF